MKIERNLNYDLIRLLGLLIIMIAHSSPPDWLFQLRNFGTPLLVVGSGLTYTLIYSSKKIEIGEFYSKRLKRLVLPAWIFLSFFFLFFYAASEVTAKEYPFNLKKILGSYTFMDGIGFVWVFKIYLMLALITPIAIHLNKRIDSDRFYFFLLILFYIIYELINYIVSPYLVGTINTVFNSIVFILIPYSLVYFYAFRMNRLKSNHLLILSLTSLVIFLSMAFIKYQDTGWFVSTQDFKYPPTIYYLSYAFFAINIIFIVVNKINLEKTNVKYALVWLSSNSLWVYLWHIMAFYIWKFLLQNPNGDLLIFLLKTIFLFAFGIFLTILQNRFVSILSKKNRIFKSKVAPLLSSNT
jgi:hypothetical protein